MYSFRDVGESFHTSIMKDSFLASLHLRFITTANTQVFVKNWPWKLLSNNENNSSWDLFVFLYYYINFTLLTLMTTVNLWPMLCFTRDLNGLYVPRQNKLDILYIYIKHTQHMSKMCSCSDLVSGSKLQVTRGRVQCKSTSPPSSPPILLPRFQKKIKSNIQRSPQSWKLFQWHQTELREFAIMFFNPV